MQKVYTKSLTHSLTDWLTDWLTDEACSHKVFPNGRPKNGWQTVSFYTNIDIWCTGCNKTLAGHKPKKASGSDGIPSQLLKDLSQELSPVICHIFSQSLSTGDLPDDWLTANITAIYKKGKKCKPGNNRPVSLTSVTCKLIEHVIFWHIMSHIEEHHILSHFQHGFRSGHSCKSQLLITIEDLVQNLHNNMQTDLQILDLQKAFDFVPQEIVAKTDFSWYTWTTFTVDWKMVDNENAESSCRWQNIRRSTGHIRSSPRELCYAP